MKIYWDTSALIHFWRQGRLPEIKGVTRTHTLAEIYSTLTGVGLDVEEGGQVRRRRYTGTIAAHVTALITGRLKFVDLSAAELVESLRQARNKGVEGGRVHDYLHVLSAEKAKAGQIWTGDVNDLTGLGTIPVKVVSDEPVV